MDLSDPKSELLSPALLAEAEAVAAAEHRHVRDLLREAIERYLGDRRPRKAPTLTERDLAQDAAARILERRKLHPLPQGMSIGDLITFGRA